MKSIARIAVPAFAFYLGASVALALPFASPIWGPLALGARFIYALTGVR